MCEKEISPNAEYCPNCGEPVIKKQESDLFNIILINSGNSRINIIHQIKNITGCGLKEARDSVDNAPSIVIKNINYLKALDYKNLFESLGSVIKIMPVNMNQKFNDFIKQKLEDKQGLEIKCPNCDSINTKKISGASKVGSVVLFGIFSMGKLTKTYQCSKCDYRW
jgi:ribosomal protein L7/L12